MNQISERESIDGLIACLGTELLNSRCDHLESSGEGSGYWIAVKLDEVSEKGFDEMKRGGISGKRAETKEKSEDAARWRGRRRKGDQIGERKGELGVGETEKKQVEDGRRDYMRREIEMNDRFGVENRKERENRICGREEHRPLRLSLIQGDDWYPLLREDTEEVNK